MTDATPLALSAQDAALAALSLATALGAGDAARLAAFAAAHENLPPALSPSRLDFIAPLIGDMAAAADGFETVLTLIGSAVPPAQSATCYALTADYIALHDAASPEHMRLLERLGEVLKLDRLTRAALDRAALARSGPLDG